jgi:hypothetical protein
MLVELVCVRHEYEIDRRGPKQEQCEKLSSRDVRLRSARLPWRAR